MARAKKVKRSEQAQILSDIGTANDLATMLSDKYEYLLPLFVGHTFRAEHTSELRDAVQRACNLSNLSQSSTKRFHWEPRFLTDFDKTQARTVFDRVRDEIEESALALFDLYEDTSVNVFYEFGIAVGMARSFALLRKGSCSIPADLGGVLRLEYSDCSDLTSKLVTLLETRVNELQKPNPGTFSLNLKMQIDAVWHDWFSTADKDLAVFGGDLSWAEERRKLVAEAVKRGVTVKVCCLEQYLNRSRMVENLRMVAEAGAQIKLLPDGIDPKVRGLIFEPSPNPEPRCQVMVVDKRQRRNAVTNFRREGITVGEGTYRYDGSVFRGDEHHRQTSAMVRLFNSVWQSPDATNYRKDAM